MSRIEWTDETWNPAVGCERVSPGCDNCYAVRVAHRQMQPAHVGLTGFDDSGERRPGPYWTGEVRLLPERLEEPLRWRKPRRVFVGSMTDLFHPAVPNGFIEDVFGVMARAPQHTFQLLTKRSRRMAAWASWPLRAGFTHWAPVQDRVPGCERMAADEWPGWPLPNVWLGTSVENQRYADLRIPHLLATPAAVRFLSIEPLLGPVWLDMSDWWDPCRAGCECRQPDDADRFDCGCDGPCTGGTEELDEEWRARTPKIGWVIVGGESGPGARPMHPQWVRDLRDQCVEAGVPFFFKQHGEWAPACNGANAREACWVLLDGSTRGAPSACPAEGAVPIWRIGKKAAGRELDGRTWDEYPERA